MWGAPGGIWQNKRNSAAFSDDGGETYYLVSESKQGEQNHIYVSEMKPKGLEAAK